MKTTDLPAARNGASAPGRARAVSSAVVGAPHKRSERRRAPNPASKAHAQPLAPFAAIPSEPMDAEMWTLTPVLWLQPELSPAVPASSGLIIQRRCTVPGADFLYLELLPICPTHALAGAGNGLPPQLPQQLPQSNLKLLGWDPRVLPGRGRQGGDT